MIWVKNELVLKRLFIFVFLVMTSVSSYKIRVNLILSYSLLTVQNMYLLFLFIYFI